MMASTAVSTQPCSQARPKGVPFFSPSEENHSMIEAHLAIMEHEASVKAWTQDKLAGTVLDTLLDTNLDKQELSRMKRWDDFKQFLISKYGQTYTVNQKFQLMQGLSKDSSEDCHHYLIKVKQLCKLLRPKHCYCDNSDFIRVLFLAGLQDEEREFVKNNLVNLEMTAETLNLNFRELDSDDKTYTTDCESTHSPDEPNLIEVDEEHFQSCSYSSPNGRNNDGSSISDVNSEGVQSTAGANKRCVGKSNGPNGGSPPQKRRKQRESPFQESKVTPEDFASDDVDVMWSDAGCSIGLTTNHMYGSVARAVHRRHTHQLCASGLAVSAD